MTCYFAETLGASGPRRLHAGIRRAPAAALTREQVELLEAVVRCAEAAGDGERAAKAGVGLEELRSDG